MAHHTDTLINDGAVTIDNGAIAGRWGVMIDERFCGDADGAIGRFTMSGGSLSAALGPTFYVTNATGVITLTGVSVSDHSGVLLQVAAARWGTPGSNGGNAVVHATGQKLVGDVIVDYLSTAQLTLAQASMLTGAIDTAHTAGGVTLTLDATSDWVVTADSHVTSVRGINLAGGTVTNLHGNGHTVRYDATVSTALGGRTYDLAGGGFLTPA